MRSFFSRGVGTHRLKIPSSHNPVTSLLPEGSNLRLEIEICKTHQIPSGLGVSLEIQGREGRVPQATIAISGQGASS